ncbi:hypothetical protein [Goekera deserti]|uniref:Uncharacterized protein n=1 Tax=Goekera deserti TaxID=2497753 RepID=A0A7K3WBM9_9ACTN|nr:hypothetical protein [Goekera deserti]NDI48119.1 hypothetical protein [Goekera deserti]NEL53868.1 hypothetical protein [Goekera deserti]
MTSTGLFLTLLVLAIGSLCATTVLLAARGGRGPGDPPASHPPPSRQGWGHPAGHSRLG